MSLKQRIYDLATQTARQVALQISATRITQMQQSSSSMAQVVSVKGNMITLNMPDGTQQTVVNLGGRIVGPGDAMLTNGINGAF